MNTYSCRAETQVDVDRFRLECQKAGLVTSMKTTSEYGFPDVEIEFQTEASLDRVRGVMRQVVDGHVMLQTLQACPRGDVESGLRDRA